MSRIGNYIHGKCVNGKSTDELSVFNPSTGEELSKVILSNSDDFNEVIESSKNGLNEWSNFTPLKRSRILLNRSVLGQ